MIVFIVTFLSFILEYVVNGFFHGSILTGLIVFSSLVLLEPYFKKNKDKYFIYCFIVGFFYDLVYTGTYFLNSGLFLVIGICVSYINGVTPNNFIVTIFELVLMIGVYRIIGFIYFGFNGYVNMSFNILFKSFYCSLIINILYGIVLYFVLYLISLKFNIKRIK